MRLAREPDRLVVVGLLIALGLWGLAPLAFLAIHVLGNGGTLTGADGIVGSDQLQYLAWARDAGAHGLASNLFELRPTAHVYAQPIFTLSGVLWWLGLPMVPAYWLWKPLAVLVLFTGAWAWCRRLVGARAGARVAAVALALFLYTPLAWIAQWGELGSVTNRNGIGVLAGEIFSAGDLWGYLPSAIAVGLMPLVLLACERALRTPAPARHTALAGLGALLVSWLHPWQGVTLVLILGALWIWCRARETRVLAVAAVAGLLPLVYYELLARLDPAWKLAAHNELVPRLPGLMLLAGLGPLLVLAAAGIRRPGPDLGERALLLWIPAGLVAYLAVSAFPAHALAGLSLPLAVLMVRGWRRLAIRRWLAPVGAVALAAVTLPGMAYDVRSLHDATTGPLRSLYYLTPGDGRALRWLAGSGPTGGVLARTIFAVGIPAETGRRVWVGHEFWSQNWLARARQADALFAGTITGSAARELVVRSGARLVVKDCGASADPRGSLAPIITSAHRFGCASVYVVR